MRCLIAFQLFALALFVQLNFSHGQECPFGPNILLSTSDSERGIIFDEPYTAAVVNSVSISDETFDRILESKIEGSGDDTRIQFLPRQPAFTDILDKEGQDFLQTATTEGLKLMLDNGNTLTCQIYLRITDTNNQPPVFSRTEKLVFNVPSTWDTNLPLNWDFSDSLQVTDLDFLEDNAKVTIIPNGNIRGTVNPSPRSPPPPNSFMYDVLLFLNSDVPASGNYSVTASDEVNEATLDIEIIVTQENLHDPVFRETGYHFVFEDMPRIGQDVPIGINAFDPDTPDEPEYSVAPNDYLEYSLESKKLFFKNVDGLEGELKEFTITATEKNEDARSTNVILSLKFPEPRLEELKFKDAPYIISYNIDWPKAGVVIRPDLTAEVEGGGEETLVFTPTNIPLFIELVGDELRFSQDVSEDSELKANNIVVFDVMVTTATTERKAYATFVVTFPLMSTTTTTTTTVSPPESTTTCDCPPTTTPEDCPSTTPDIGTTTPCDFDCSTCPPTTTPEGSTCPPPEDCSSSTTPDSGTTPCECDCNTSPPTTPPDGTTCPPPEDCSSSTTPWDCSQCPTTPPDEITCPPTSTTPEECTCPPPTTPEDGSSSSSTAPPGGSSSTTTPPGNTSPPPTGCPPTTTPEICPTTPEDCSCENCPTSSPITGPTTTTGETSPCPTTPEDCSCENCPTTCPITGPTTTSGEPSSPCPTTCPTCPTTSITTLSTSSPCITSSTPSAGTPCPTTCPTCPTTTTLEPCECEGGPSTCAPCPTTCPTCPTTSITTLPTSSPCITSTTPSAGTCAPCPTTCPTTTTLEPCDCNSSTTTSTCRPCPCDQDGDGEEDDCSNTGLLVAVIVTSVLCAASICAAGYLVWLLRKASIDPIRMERDNSFLIPKSNSVNDIYKPDTSAPNDNFRFGNDNSRMSFGGGMSTLPGTNPVEPGITNPSFSMDKPQPNPRRFSVPKANLPPATTTTPVPTPTPTVTPAVVPPVDNSSIYSQPVKKSNIKSPKEIEPDYEERPVQKSPERKLSVKRESNAHIKFAPEDEYISIDKDEAPAGGGGGGDGDTTNVDLDSDSEYERL
ncbi:unnamed protein product [Orchesella dallaii]|uniref:Cadherin domain-containing protein n=1 Tax=Orchesella dallaii TaxID=48710 RepID=A0ABP1RAR5_9HEXA